jgi:hypothetical protein
MYFDTSLKTSRKYCSGLFSIVFPSPYQTPAKNDITTPSNNEGDADHKKDIEKVRS